MAQINWKKYFDEKANTFGSSVKTSNYFNEKSFFIQRDNTLNWVGDLKNKTILDAGCGVGAFSEPYVKNNTVYGVDFSEKSLEYAAQRGLKTFCEDLTNLPFEDGKFDLILCIGVIQHIDRHDKVIKELARTLKPGGILLVETLNRSSIQRKILSVVDKEKKFDKMYQKKELKSVFESCQLKDIEFMSIYYPFEFVTSTKNASGLHNYLSTSFAIKGVKTK